MAKIGHVPNFVWFLSVAEMAAQLLLQWVPEPDIWASPHSSHFGLVCIFWPYCTPSQVWVPYSPPGFCCLTDKRQSLQHISHQLIKCVLACQSNSTFVFGGDTVFSTWLDWYPLIFVTSLEPELRTSWPSKKVLLSYYSLHQGWKILFEITLIMLAPAFLQK